ncbi:hypothetical protein V496_02145 [Pseudogymnoascus sp. VKM F-4515 (FW-2607)]|nr:hypothetical protein V496_02145 [Pseudogymnoascus sp. VKM F-4515 (FW-2607)]
MTSWAKDQINLEVFKIDSAFHHKRWLSSSGWTDFESLGGVFIYTPAAVSFPEEKLHLYGVGSDSALWHKYCNTAGGWDPPGISWKNLGGICASPPIAVHFGADSVAAFIIGTDRACWVNTLEGNGEGTWESLGETFIGDSLTVASLGKGRMDVIGTRGQLLHTSYSNNKWDPSWMNLGGVWIGKPKAIAPREGRVDIFVKGGYSNMFHIPITLGTRPQQPNPLGEVHLYEPDAVSWDTNRIDVFSVSTNSQLIHAYADITSDGNFNFGEWEKLGICTGSPRALARAPDHLDVFVKGLNQQVLHHHKKWNGSPWELHDHEAYVRVCVRSKRLCKNALRSSYPLCCAFATALPRDDALEKRGGGHRGGIGNGDVGEIEIGGVVGGGGDGCDLDIKCRKLGDRPGYCDNGDRSTGLLGACTSLNNNPSNCGIFGNTCPAGSTSSSGACICMSFQAQATIPVGSMPGDVAVGDFNGDGHLDIVVSNFNDNTVSVLLRTGSGSFQPQAKFPVRSARSAPYRVAVGDFDGDGHLDIVITNSVEDTVSVLLGTGTGNYQPQAIFPVGYGPIGVAVGDFDGDGHLDIVASNWFDNTVSVLLGTGSGASSRRPHSPWGPGRTALQWALRRRWPSRYREYE